MSFSSSLKKMSFRSLQGPIKLLVKATVLPDDPVKEFALDIAKPIHYVIGHYSATDLNVLHQYCIKSGLPSPLSDENDSNYIFVRKKRRFWNRSSNYLRHQPRLAKLLEEQQRNPEEKPQLVPVTISWGRNPGKDKSLF